MRLDHLRVGWFSFTFREHEHAFATANGHEGRGNMTGYGGYQRTNPNMMDCIL